MFFKPLKSNPQIYYCSKSVENCLFMCQYLCVLRFTCHAFFFYSKHHFIDCVFRSKKRSHWPKISTLTSCKAMTERMDISLLNFCLLWIWVLTLYTFTQFLHVFPTYQYLKVTVHSISFKFMSTNYSVMWSQTILSTSVRTLQKGMNCTKF